MSEEPRDFVEGEVFEGDARGAVPEVVEPERLRPVGLRPAFAAAVWTALRTFRLPGDLPPRVWKTSALAWMSVRLLAACRPRCARSSRARAGRSGTVAVLAAVLVPGTAIVPLSRSTSAQVKASASETRRAASHSHPRHARPIAESWPRGFLKGNNFRTPDQQASGELGISSN
jgi:hypothetical protein